MCVFFFPLLSLLSQAICKNVEYFWVGVSGVYMLCMCESEIKVNHEKQDSEYQWEPLPTGKMKKGHKEDFISV